MPQPSVQQKLDEFEHRKAMLQTELEKPAPSPVRLHPNLAELYRDKVQCLRAALDDPETRDEALGILRELVERVDVTSKSKGDQPYRAMFELVVARQADLVAKWLLVGFIHGVMNTDNTSIAGETIDYGPCAFLDAYHPETVFSSIDQQGRYAYGNQPRIATWNLARFAETLLPLFSDDSETALAQANESLGTFSNHFSRTLGAGQRRKLGIFTERDGDAALAEDLLNAMAESNADFTLTFRHLCDAAGNLDRDADVRRLFDNPATYESWVRRWRQRLADEPQDGPTRRAAMAAVNPAFIPRNHRVEAALSAATEHGDFGPFEELLTVLSKPFEDQAAFTAYADPPRPEQRVYRTFCGT